MSSAIALQPLGPAAVSQLGSIRVRRYEYVAQRTALFPLSWHKATGAHTHGLVPMRPSNSPVISP